MGSEVCLQGSWLKHGQKDVETVCKKGLKSYTLDKEMNLEGLNQGSKPGELDELLFC